MCVHSVLTPFNSIGLLQEAEGGKQCEGQLKPILNSKNCNKAQVWLKKMNPSYKTSKFAIASGNGVDLPFGCISDKVSRNHYVYWNPKGKAISADSNLRLICEKPTTR